MGAIAPCFSKSFLFQGKAGNAPCAEKVSRDNSSNFDSFARDKTAQDSRFHEQRLKRPSRKRQSYALSSRIDSGNLWRCDWVAAPKGSECHIMQRAVYTDDTSKGKKKNKARKEDPDKLQVGSKKGSVLAFCPRKAGAFTTKNKDCGTGYIQVTGKTCRQRDYGRPEDYTIAHGSLGVGHFQSTSSCPELDLNAKFSSSPSRSSSMNCVVRFAKNLRVTANNFRHKWGGNSSKTAFDACSHSGKAAGTLSISSFFSKKFSGFLEARNHKKNSGENSGKKNGDPLSGLNGLSKNISLKDKAGTRGLKFNPGDGHNTKLGAQYLSLRDERKDTGYGSDDDLYSLGYDPDNASQGGGLYAFPGKRHSDHQVLLKETDEAVKSKLWSEAVDIDKYFTEDELTGKLRHHSFDNFLILPTEKNFREILDDFDTRSFYKTPYVQKRLFSNLDGNPNFSASLVKSRLRSMSELQVKIFSWCTFNEKTGPMEEMGEIDESEIMDESEAMDELDTWEADGRHNVDN